MNNKNLKIVIIASLILTAVGVFTLLPITSLASVCEPSGGSVASSTESTGDDCIPNPPPLDINVIATKIVCNSESDLPNWSAGSTNISAGVIENFVNSHPNCHRESGWS